MMVRWPRYSTPRTRRPMLKMVLAAAFLAEPSYGLITGGEGNRPLTDLGFPKGAIEILNDPARIAWWEGPPFGGGQWHAEYRGDAESLNDILAAFSKLEVVEKRVVLHDGVGSSFWLNPNNRAEEAADARVDWTFMVWQPDSWARLRDLPPDLNPLGGRDAEGGPPSQIDIYTGGNVRWADVTVPTGLQVVDERLEAHGFKRADSAVLEGNVTDPVTKKPVAAEVRLERIEPQPKGGYSYPRVTNTTADKAGHWVLKNVPEGWYRGVVEAEGYVPRVAFHTRITDQPHWQSCDCGLVRPGAVSGQVADEAGVLLAGVQVRLGDVGAGGTGRYESPREYMAQTDAAGRFRLEQVPVGTATVWVSKPGYCRSGLGPPITVPAERIAISMKKAARLRVTVDFGELDRPGEYIVELEPEGGSQVGSWGGSARVNELGWYVFENVPPGRYRLKGHPNPASEGQHTKPVAIELKGGEEKQITLIARDG